MEDNTPNIVEQLGDKLMRLVELHKQSQAATEALLQENRSLQEELHREREFITVLKEKNKQLQLAEAFKASSVDTNDAKMKIGRIVKEIDKCISLLNR